MHADSAPDDSDDSYGTIGSVTTADIAAVNTPGNCPIFCNMLINKQPVKLQVDCVATVNLLSKKYIPDLYIRREDITLKMWNNSTLKALGKCRVKTVNRATGEKWKIDFVIVEQDLTPLLSRKAAEQMNLITVNYDNFHSVSLVTPDVSSNFEALIGRFPQVFDENLGRLPGSKVHLIVNADAEPVVRPARTLPEALRPAVLAELNRLENIGVLTKVDEPSDWVNQMAVVEKKSGAVRLCIDPRPLNASLKREHFKLPVLDDVLPKLTSSKRFAVCDLKQGYLHCELDEEPFGRYRWLRLPLGSK